MLVTPYTHRLFMVTNPYDYSTEFYRLYYGIQNQLYYNHNLTLKTDIVKSIDSIDFDKIFTPGRVELKINNKQSIVAVLSNFPCQTLERAKFEYDPRIKIDITDQIHTGLYARFEGFEKRKNNDICCELSVICPTCLNCLKIFDIDVVTDADTSINADDENKTKSLVEMLNNDLSNYEIPFISYKRNNTDNNCEIRYYARNVLVHCDLTIHDKSRGYPQDIDLIEFVKNKIKQQMDKYII